MHTIVRYVFIYYCVNVFFSTDALVTNGRMRFYSYGCACFISLIAIFVPTPLLWNSRRRHLAHYVVVFPRALVFFPTATLFSNMGVRTFFSTEACKFCAYACFGTHALLWSPRIHSIARIWGYFPCVVVYPSTQTHVWNALLRLIFVLSACIVGRCVCFTTHPLFLNQQFRCFFLPLCKICDAFVILKHTHTYNCPRRPSFLWLCRVVFNTTVVLKNTFPCILSRTSGFLYTLMFFCTRIGYY